MPTKSHRDRGGRDSPPMSDGWSMGSLEKEALTVIQGDPPSAGWLGRAHTATCVPITKGKGYPTTGGGRE